MINMKPAARVYSATALNDDKIEKLKTVIQNKIGYEVDLILETDSSLIGGLYIHIAGFVLDFSVKKQINDMKESVLRGSII